MLWRERMRKKKENDWMQEIIEKYDRRYNRKPKWKRWNKVTAPPPNLYPSVKKMYNQVLQESLDEQ